MEQVRVSLLPPRQDANPAQGYPLSILPGFYSWVEKGTLKSKVFAHTSWQMGSEPNCLKVD